jgi:hypothetical protein
MRRIVPALLALLAVCPTTPAIETDQYYAWGRPLADSTTMLNAKFNLEVNRVLEIVNDGPLGGRDRCDKIRKRIVGHFRLFIFHDLELWVNNTALIERIPADPAEELEYRKTYLYHNRGKFDFVTMVPPSPTIELNGVRFGTDKLTHFLSQGWWYLGWYQKGLRKGLSVEEAELRAIDRGIFTERTVLGKVASGVVSVSDLEANYDGMRFLLSMCEGSEPLLEKTDEGWQLTRPLDLREYVKPAWDESWEPSIYTRHRWKRVMPVMERYCPMLDDQTVLEQRARYESLDTATPTESRIDELVE